MLGLGCVWSRVRFIFLIVGDLRMGPAWNSDIDRFLNKSGSP